MSDRERMLDDLDAYRWHLLAQLADEAEENGRELEARAWRWLLEWKRWPKQRGGWGRNKGKFGWIFGEVSLDELERRAEFIPRRMTKGNYGTSHASVRTAMEKAVEILVQWMEKEERSYRAFKTQSQANNG